MVNNSSNQGASDPEGKGRTVVEVPLPFVHQARRPHLSKILHFLSFFVNFFCKIFIRFPSFFIKTMSYIVHPHLPLCLLPHLLQHLLSLLLSIILLEQSHSNGVTIHNDKLICNRGDNLYFHVTGQKYLLSEFFIFLLAWPKQHLELQDKIWKGRFSFDPAIWSHVMTTQKCSRF